MSDLPVLTIESCKDCPRFKSKFKRHWMGPSGYEYTCDQAGRTIMPNDGIKPPPSWCPKRDKS